MAGTFETNRQKNTPAKECMKAHICKKVTNFDNAPSKFYCCTFSVVLQFLPARCLL